MHRPADTTERAPWSESPSEVDAWIVGLVVSTLSVVLAAVLWTRRTP
jgi:hypothetical protein